MAGEEAAWKGRGIQYWGALWASYVNRLLTPWRLSIGLTLLFFLLTLFIYYFTFSSPQAFNGPVRQADAFLQGRLDIPNGADLYWIEWAPYKGKFYPVEPPMAAIVVLPGVILFGLALNQTLVSIVIGAITASSVYRLMRGLTEKLSVQVWLTLLFVFGTIFWWVAVNGAVWQFSHTVAVLFLFLAIYETLVSKRPFLAGLFLGAALLSRLPTILSLPFFIIMFSDQWLPKSDEKSLVKRINFIPLLKFGAGLGILMGLGGAYYYLAFDTPLPAASHHHFAQYFERSPPAPLLDKGIFDISYVGRHLPGVFKNLPTVQSNPPYVVPFGNGIAIWATTPAFLYAFFAGVRNKFVIRAGVALLAVTLTVYVLTADSLPIALDIDFPHGLEYYPFALLVLLGLFVGLRDKFILACWAAIIPISLLIFTYAITASALSYADRFTLDYYPFLFLLTARAMGSNLNWHHKILIGLGIIVNLWAVLWIYQFNLNGFLGLQWAPW